MKYSCAALAFSLFLVLKIEAAKQESEAKESNLAKYAIEHPWPEYPFRARANYYNGEGLFAVHVDRETGNVLSVDVIKTTTHKILDDSAIKAFLRWRFRPHTVETVRIPVAFTLKNHPLSEARRLATYAPDPSRPVTNRSGSGTYRFIVDYATGKVIDVQVIKSSGNKSFDQSVLEAYRQWRFLPNKVHSIDMTSGFV